MYSLARPLVTALIVAGAGLQAVTTSAQTGSSEVRLQSVAAAAQCAESRFTECRRLYEKALAAAGIRPARLRWSGPGFEWLSSRKFEEPVSIARAVTGWADASLQLFEAKPEGDLLLDAVGGARAANDLIKVHRWSARLDALEVQRLDAEVRRAADVELDALFRLPREAAVVDAAYEVATTTRTRRLMDFLWAQFEMHRRPMRIDIERGQLRRVEREIEPEKQQLIRLSFVASLLEQTMELERREPQPRKQVIDQLRSELHSVYAGLLNELGKTAESAQLGGRSVLQNLDITHDTARRYGKRRDPRSQPRAAEALPSKHGVLQFHVTDRHVFAFLVHAPGTLFEPKPAQTEMFFIGESAALERLVNRLVLQLSSPEQRGWEFTATELYGRLLSQVLSAERSIEFLYIVPSRFLFRLPFGVLRDPRDGRSLSDKVPHAYLPHADALPLMGFEREARPRALAVGVRHFSSHQELQLAEDEATRVSETLPFATDLRLGSKGQAVADALLPELDRYGIIHVGSHATRDGRPWLSGLVLKTADERDTALPAYRFLTLPRPLQPGLVVLSACETGVVQVDENDDPQGLPVALLAAGTGVLVVSLWKVPERATASLMREFYGVLAEKRRKSVSEALAKAQERVRQSQEYGHPFFWGAFVAIGDGKVGF